MSTAISTVAPSFASAPSPAAASSSRPISIPSRAARPGPPGRPAAGARAERVHHDSPRRQSHDHRQEPRDRTGHQDDAADADRRGARRRLEARSPSSRAISTPSTGTQSRRRQHGGARATGADAAASARAMRGRCSSQPQRRAWGVPEAELHDGVRPCDARRLEAIGSATASWLTKASAMTPPDLGDRRN